MFVKRTIEVAHYRNRIPHEEVQVVPVQDARVPQQQKAGLLDQSQLSQAIGVVLELFIRQKAEELHKKLVIAGVGRRGCSR